MGVDFHLHEFVVFVLELDEVVELKGGSVRESCISFGSLTIEPVDMVLGPVLPFFLSSDVFNLDEVVKLESRSVWKSSIGLGSLSIEPIVVLLSPLLPFLFTSHNTFELDEIVLLEELLQVFLSFLGPLLLTLDELLLS